MVQEVFLKHLFLCSGDTSKRGEKSVRVEELYCGNSTNVSQLCKEAENAPGGTSTCVVKTRLSDLLVSPAQDSFSCQSNLVPLFHLEQNPTLRPCRLTSPASDATYLFLPGGLSSPIEAALKQKILPTTDPQDSLRGVCTMTCPLRQVHWANLQHHSAHIPYGQNSNTLGGKAHMQGQHANQYNRQMRTSDYGYGYNNGQHCSGNTYGNIIETLLCHLPGDISARHIRPVELPLQLSTTDPPTSPAIYAHFNGMDNFVGKDTHNAQSKGNDGDTDHDQFNGNDGFDGKGNFDGNDNDRMIMTLHSTMVVMLQRVAVFALALIAIMPDSMARTILVIVLVRDDNNTDCNGNDNLNFYDNVNVNDNFNDKDRNDSQFNDHDNLYGNGIHSNNARFHVKDNFGGSVSFEGNDNRNTHSNGNDNLNFNDNFNFHFNDNFDDQERNHSQFNDNYSNDTNSDRFPPPPPRGRKRRQTTLWSSQTGETNTSESGSLVWLPDENSALKAPEHE